jgi:hypothetical protein
MADWINEYESFKNQDWKPTSLPKSEEPKFQEWLQKTKLFDSVKQEIAAENKIPVNALDDNRVLKMLLNSKDYDYRGAYKAKIKEEISPHDNKPHWPSSTEDGRMLKSPQHETAWKEFFMRKYNKDPDDIGLHDYESAKKFDYQQKMLDSRKQKRGLIEGAM